MNIKATFLVFLLLVAMHPVHAANSGKTTNSLYSSCYDNLPVALARPAAPDIPERRLSIADFGANGDGVSLNTEVFAAAINRLHALGGGHLNVPAGIYLTGPIRLLSNIDLHLDDNATILFSPDKSLYLADDPDGRLRGRCQSLLTVDSAHDVAITGGGIVDGNGKYWRPVKHGKMSDTEWNRFLAMGGEVTDDGSLWYPFHLKGQQEVFPSREKVASRRNDLLRILDSKRILLQGVTFQNSPRFHVHPYFSQDIIIDGITVRSPWNAQNSDGIDLTNVQRALIVNTTVNVGDDGLCMKGGVGSEGVGHGPVKDILIDNCRVYHAHGGFVIGSDCSGGMENIVVRHCTFSGTDVGLRFKSGEGRGGLTHNVFLDSIYMSDITQQAIIFENTYVDRSVQQSAKKQSANGYLPDFTDVHFSNVFCREANTGLLLRGIPSAYIHGLSFCNVVISEASTPFSFTCARDISFDNVVINGNKIGSLP